MSKLVQKFKSNEVQSIINSAKFKVSTMSGVALIACQTVAHADDTAVLASMSTTFTSVSSLCLSAVAAVAPVAVTIFGCMFAWKKGIVFFKDLTKA